MGKANSNDWWHGSKELLAKNTGRENMTPLRSGDTLVKDPASKASLLASTFAFKARLHDQVVNEYAITRPPRDCLGCFLRIRDRDVLKISMKLDVASGT